MQSRYGTGQARGANQPGGTSRGTSFRGELFRADAEALDEEIDGMLGLHPQVPLVSPSSSDASPGRQADGSTARHGRN